MPSPEDDLIARHFAPIAGEGGLRLLDDAALISVAAGCELVVTTDGISAGRHFLDDPPDAIARKALRVNLSDLAAKGADPLGFVLTIALPARWKEAEREAFLAPFAKGLGEDAQTYGCPLVGGDTIATDGPLTISVTAFGSVPAGRMVPRAGARPGDLIVVSGTIGDAAIGLKLRYARDGDSRKGRAALLSLGATEQAHLLDAYVRPRPRNAIARALRDHAHAALDISDGFVGDIVKMLRASGVGGEIDAEAAPLSAAARAAIAIDADMRSVALTGGDDYEIAASCPPQAWPAFHALAQETGVALTVVGRVGGRGEPARIVPAAFDALLSRASFSHF